jgi:hypothetical protein
MKVHPEPTSPPSLAVLIVLSFVLSARSNSLFDAAVMFGVLLGGGNVVHDMETKSTEEAKVALNIANPARSLMAESMLAIVFEVTGMLKLMCDAVTSLIEVEGSSYDLWNCRNFVGIRVYVYNQEIMGKGDLTFLYNSGDTHKNLFHDSRPSLIQNLIDMCIH